MQAWSNGKQELPLPTHDHQSLQNSPLSSSFSAACGVVLYKINTTLHFTQATLVHLQFFFSCSANLHSETCPYFVCHGFGAFIKNNVHQESTHPGTLKWKSQDITNANTMQARRKLRNRCPCQNLRGSLAVAWAAAVLLDSFHCSMKSASQKPATLHAVEPQISQILRQWKKGWRSLKEILVWIE